MDASHQPLARAAPPSLSSFQILQSPAWKKIPCSSDTNIMEAEAVSSSPRSKLGISIKNAAATSRASPESSFPNIPLGRNLMSPEKRKKLLWEWATLGVEAKPAAVHEVSDNDPIGVKTVDLREEKEDIHDSMDDTDQASRSGNESPESGEENDVAEEVHSVIRFTTIESKRKLNPSGTSADNLEYAAASEVPAAVHSEETMQTPKKAGEEGTVTGKNDGEGGAFGSPLSVGPSSTQASPEKYVSVTDQPPLESEGSRLRGEGRGRRSGAANREDGGDTDRIVPVRKIWAQETEAGGGWEAERLRSLRDPAGRARSPRGRFRTATALARASLELSDGGGEDKPLTSISKAAETLAVDPEFMIEPESDLVCAVIDSKLGPQLTDPAPPDAPELVVENETILASADSSSDPCSLEVSPLHKATDGADAASDLTTVQGTPPLPLPPAPASAPAPAPEVSGATVEDLTPHSPMAASTTPQSVSGGAIDALVVGSPRRSRKTWVIGPEGKTLPRSNSLSDLPDQSTASGEGSEVSINLQGDTLELKVARNLVVREREELERQWKEGKEELDRAAQMAHALKTAVESLAKAHVLRSESSAATASPTHSGLRHMRNATTASTATSSSFASASSLALFSQRSSIKRFKHELVAEAAEEEDHSGVARWLAQGTASGNPTPSQSVSWALPSGSVSEETTSSPVGHLKWETCSEEESVGSAPLPGNFHNHQPTAPALPRRVTPTRTKSGERKISSHLSYPSPQSSPTDRFTVDLPPAFDGEFTSHGSELPVARLSISTPSPPQPHPTSAPHPTLTTSQPVLPATTITETNMQPPTTAGKILETRFSPTIATMPPVDPFLPPPPPKTTSLPPPPPTRVLGPGFWPSTKTTPTLGLPFPPLPPLTTPAPITRQSMTGGTLPKRTPKTGGGMVGRRLPSFWPASDTEDEAPLPRGQSERPARIGAGWSQVRNRGQSPVNRSQTQANHGQAPVRAPHNQYPPLAPRPQPLLNPSAHFGPKETRVYPGQKQSQVAVQEGPLPEMVSRAVEESMREGTRKVELGKQSLCRMTGRVADGGYQSELSPPKREGSNITTMHGMGAEGGGFQRPGPLGEENEKRGAEGRGWYAERPSFSHRVQARNPALQARVQDQIAGQVGGGSVGSSRGSLREKFGAGLAARSAYEPKQEVEVQRKFRDLVESGEWREALRRGQDTMGGAINAPDGGGGGGAEEKSEEEKVGKVARFPSPRRVGRLFSGGGERRSTTPTRSPLTALWSNAG